MYRKIPLKFQNTKISRGPPKELRSHKIVDAFFFEEICSKFACFVDTCMFHAVPENIQQLP
jgi:hypothetical protein